MIEKDCERVKEIKQQVSNLSCAVIESACDINNLSEVIFDYCAYNVNPTTGNIMTIAEVMKAKTKDLIDTVDSKDIEISQL